MSTLSTIKRHHRIIHFLRRKPASFEQINNHLQTEGLGITNRTFLRDKQAIEEIYNIEIGTRKSDNTYFIVEDTPNDYISHAFEMMQVHKMAGGMQDTVFFETRRPAGMEHLPELLIAVKERRIAHFTYIRIWKGDEAEYIVHPLALKESQGRWYLVAGVPTGGHQLRFFCLDRIKNLDANNPPYRHKYLVDLSALFKPFFGAFVYEQLQPQTVKLCFTLEQGRYVENYPLHHTQQSLSIDIERHELTVGLEPCITEDFVMELLRYGSDLTILAPESLAIQVQDIYKDALSWYNK